MLSFLSAARACAALAALTGLAALLSGCEDLALGTGAGSGGSATPPAAGSDIEILGLIATRPDTAGGADITSAQLAVMSLRSDPPRYLGGISEASLLAGAVEIPLLSSETGGVFATDSRRSALRYVPGNTYTFRFTITDSEGTEQTVTSQVVAPEEAPSFEIDPALIYYAGEPLTITMQGLADGALVSVVKLGGTTPTITYSTLAYDGPAMLDDAYNSLIATAEDRVFTIPGDAFESPGTYRVEVTSYALNAEALGGNDLPGPNSWVAAGALSFQQIDVN
jgi:hypothetical protein